MCSNPLLIKWHGFDKIHWQETHRGHEKPVGGCNLCNMCIHICDKHGQRPMDCPRKCRDLKDLRSANTIVDMYVLDIAITILTLPSSRGRAVTVLMVYICIVFICYHQNYNLQWIFMKLKKMCFNKKNVRTDCVYVVESCHQELCLMHNQFFYLLL